MRVLLDTNVLVSAALARPDEPLSGMGWIVRVAFLGQRRFENISSDRLIYELRRALQRQAALDPVSVNEFVDMISAVSTLVRTDGLSMGVGDPGDDKVVETAVNANVDVVVSDDHDLHDVRVHRTIGKVGIGIRERPIRVWTARTFLDALHGRPGFSPLVVPATLAA